MILVSYRGRLGDPQCKQMGKLRLKQLNQAFPLATFLINPEASPGQEGGIKAGDLGTLQINKTLCLVFEP